MGPLSTKLEEVKKLLQEGYSHRKISEMTGVSTGSISRCRTKYSWDDIPAFKVGAKPLISVDKIMEASKGKKMNAVVIKKYMLENENINVTIETARRALRKSGLKVKTPEKVEKVKAPAKVEKVKPPAKVEKVKPPAKVEKVKRTAEPKPKKEKKKKTKPTTSIQNNSISQVRAIHRLLLQANQRSKGKMKKNVIKASATLQHF